MAERELPKMRWTTGDQGVWIRVRDASCLEIEAYNDKSKSDYFYKIKPGGGEQEYKYYAGYNFHRTMQRAFDRLAERGVPIDKPIDVHVRKMEEGAQKYWLVADTTELLADSRLDFEISDAGRARTKNKRKDAGQPQQQQGAPAPAAAPNAAPPPAGPAPAPHSQQTGGPPDRHQPSQVPVDTTPAVHPYVLVLAKMRRCLQLAEALVLHGGLEGNHDDSVGDFAIAMFQHLQPDYVPPNASLVAAEVLIKEYSKQQAQPNGSAPAPVPAGAGSSGNNFDADDDLPF